MTTENSKKLTNIQEDNQELCGLTTETAKKLQDKYGKNLLNVEKKQTFFKKAIHVIAEPMFLLLIIAAVIYFILGEARDGAIMLVFVIGIISIDISQEWKTDKTLNALKDLSAPHITVIRDGVEKIITSCDLVPGDLMKIVEGVKIPADGLIIKSNDLCINESTLTGEAEGVWKVSTYEAEPSHDHWRKDYCYAGTLVTHGAALVIVDKIGTATEYGKIAKDISEVPEEPTPLQRQTGGLVKLCTGIAAVLFALVGMFTYFNISDYEFSDRIIQSILSGITLAMAMIPEEFPVILTVFLSMGAWRLAKKQSLVRKLSSVETLGAVSVLCVDKTGTITMNEMSTQEVWTMGCEKEKFFKTVGMACEIEAYDQMEKAIIEYCEDNGISRESLFSGELIYEYAFTNELKMMGHVWEKNGEITVAVKGSPERVMELCELGNNRIEFENKIENMTKEGLRVIAVAEMKLSSRDDIPKNITDCKLSMLGLVGLADPVRESVKNDIAVCNSAGIRVVMITGDNGVTASAIANKIGMNGCGEIITGDMLDSMSDDELKEKIKNVNIFSRVVPEHKMRIVKAFKAMGEVVAMTGDGVNDAAALKYADIGIAMGKRGSEVSREAADLILLDDNFTTIVETVRDGRRIFDNIRKAVGYVFSIHIPIALVSLIAPMLGILPDAYMLLPLHVVLLELIIDPTCSVVLERQPAERDIMDRAPRNTKESMINKKILIKSVIQGLMMFFASFGTYLFMLNQDPGNVSAARSMGLAVIIIGNLLLVQVNSSNTDYMYVSMQRLIRDKVMWIVAIVTFVMLGVILYTPINHFLKLAPLSVGQLLITILIAIVSVLWYEIVKFVKKQRMKKLSAIDSL